MMSEFVFLALCCICSCFVSSYIILNYIGYKGTTFRYWFLLICNSFVLGMATLFIYPYMKMGAICIDALLMAALLSKHRGKQLLNDLKFAVLLSICEYISYPVCIYAALHFVRMPNMNVWMNAIALTITQLFVFYFYFMYKRMITDTNKEYPWFINLFQIVILPVFTYINVNVMMMLSAYYMDDVMLTYILLDMIFVVFLNIFLYYLLERMLENMLLKQTAARLEEMSRMQYSYYQKLDEKYQNSRHVLHDVKRHLQVLEAMQKNHEDTNTYLHDMRQQLQQYRQDIYSSHPIVHIIMYEKMEEAKSASIETKCQIAPIDFTFMKDMDITVLFANLLDNAIEACKVVQGHRYVYLQIDQVHDFIVFAIRNSAATAYQKDKSSKPGHQGLGLMNVQQTIEKYGGHMQIHSDHQEFCIHLYIPII